MSSILFEAGLSDFSNPMSDIRSGQLANAITISYILRPLIEMSYQLWAMVLDV